jgi:prepilin-type N-terminal cleavage/methylation domain-containing protein
VLAETRTFAGLSTSGRPRRDRAFTILEILMVIALIALLTGVLVTGGIQLTRDKSVTPEDVFWKAVMETRRIALISGREVHLSFASKSGDKEPALVARMADGTEQRFPFEQANQREFIIEFLVKQKGGGSMLLGGQLVETQTIPFVTFFADGTCSPFRLQIRAGGEPRVIEIDPWTCALVLPKGKDQR